ncbi:uncharacterized protein TNCV_1101161 [Trichonephila clavipes]|nr:uncharacterized protein TNCV_1101161 [Trichonephila clavipes]
MPTCFITRGKPVPIELSIATIPRDGSDPGNHVHHRESCRATLQSQRCSIQLPRECPSSSDTPPRYPRVCRGIPALLPFFAHANVFHHGGQPVPIELSIVSIPDDGTEPKVICITVDHSNLLTTDKDRRANRYINELLSLKSHLPGSVPLNTWISASGQVLSNWPKETEA